MEHLSKLLSYDVPEPLPMAKNFKVKNYIIIHNGGRSFCERI